jgi:hypothetical protein
VVALDLNDNTPSNTNGPDGEPSPWPMSYTASPSSLPALLPSHGSRHFNVTNSEIQCT